MKLTRHVALVGARASGKTSVARALAATLGAPWVDVDDEIAHLSGLASAGETLRTVGEATFRALETSALIAALGRSVAHVVATGGGTVLSRTNRELLRARADVVWLEVGAETLAARMRNDPGLRPALLGSDPVAEIGDVLASREALYREVALMAVDAERGSVDEVAERVRRALDPGN